jgi:hypothetical protein
LLGGWWIAIAQNVAPKRFHARESRRRAEEEQRMLASSSPTFALVGVPVDEVPVHVVTALGTIKRSGPLGLRRHRDTVPTSLRTLQRIPGGGEVAITSERRHSDGGPRPGVAESRLAVHNFLAHAELADHPLVEKRDRTFSPGTTHSLLCVRDDAWFTSPVVIDNAPTNFERVTIDEHWLALGAVEDADIAIEGHRYDPSVLELVRLDRPVGRERQ